MSDIEGNLKKIFFCSRFSFITTKAHENHIIEFPKKKKKAKGDGRWEDGARAFSCGKQHNREKFFVRQKESEENTNRR